MSEFRRYKEMRMERDQKIHSNDGGKGTEFRRNKEMRKERGQSLEDRKK